MQLREDQHGRQRVDAPKTPQPADRLAIRLGLRDLRQPGIKLQQPRLGVIDGQQIIVDDGALGSVRPRQTVDPLAVRARPIATA